MFGLCEGQSELRNRSFLGFLSAYLVLFSPNLSVDSPIDCSPNLIKGIHANSIPSTSDSHENPTLFHNHDRLEGHSANQGVRHGSRRSNERNDVQSLGMAYEQIMGC